MPADIDVTIEPLTVAKERHGFRNVFGTRRTDRTQPKISDAEQELVLLNRLLSAQETAKERAQEKVVEANLQLKAFETETKRVRGELERAQDDLADAKEEHTRDLRRAIEREAGLWNELVTVRIQVAKAVDKASGYRKFAGLALFILIPGIIWAATNYWQSVVKPLEAKTGIAQGGGKITSVHDFTSDVDRLDHALTRFPHGSVEDVLQSVHDANAVRGISVCSFEWNGGQISLLFGRQPGAGLDTSVTQCADAVEQEAKKNGL
jgi:hypothetical protein